MAGLLMFYLFTSHHVSVQYRLSVRLVAPQSQTTPHRKAPTSFVSDPSFPNGSAALDKDPGMNVRGSAIAVSRTCVVPGG